ncbi:hypothetical protein BO86DRAFT_70057 [Aspergillus japonicus CBS 114.51]|uniref:WD40 repeat-like protein n=3 Tax=Aspergillus TaxID=5052 RepID=A0A2V5H514_ASPV1|nr:hypothetical protein BO86DRAFT_70057 [Aspergillus japonicus CBS 114.51]PYI19229.1 hypothetical protein BO99DRAFT_144310 [Aspergillus violaceofuscus CBS 115571]RAH82508.1 hypothetical protein BO86DRAFT_70057 [Aspergillus japonicus CBS 114.51]
MPPAASDDLFRQQSRSPGDTIPPEDNTRLNLEHELGGKSKKKGKSGSKAKAKAAKAAAKSSPGDLEELSPPLLAEPSSCPNPTLEPPTSHNIVSPVLDALDSFGDSPENDVTYRTDTWAKSIPFGKSPPNDVTDGEFASGSPFGFLTSHDKGGFSQPSSASPSSRTRPLSYGHGYSTSNTSRQPSADRHKSNPVSSPFNNQIPLPHLPQAHFYGAPDIELPMSSAQSRPISDGGYSFCAFDTILSQWFKASRIGSNVLLVGTDGALDILAIEDQKTRLVGKLTGLNGRVIEAKLLTSTSANDPNFASRPHIAVVTHGPCSVPDDEGHASSTGSETNEIPAGRPSISGGRISKDELKYYQTRADVYSLRNGEHITTLLTTPPVQCFGNIPGMPSLAPLPVGNLKLYASGSYVIVASGSSGEVYTYGIGRYQCLGKMWTSIQSKESRRYSTSSSSTDPDGSQSDSPHGPPNHDNPIVSLRGRWLATVPPSTTYRASLRATVPAALLQGKTIGLETRSPPSRPVITCATDVGEGESFFGKVARGVTQELMRGARWMGDQGLQAWNNYWNKEQAQSVSTRRSPNLMDFSPQGYNIFPPTHSQETQTASPAEPDLVSVTDLQRLEEGTETKNALFGSMTTFQVPNGCSFLSFSPNGLMLLTVSKKGDVQYVWDLLQAKYCRAGALLSDDPTSAQPSVRQVARFSRLTASRIIDVVWCPPSGDKLAIITSKPTVHVFDLPRSAFQWPPFRRARPQPPKAPMNDLPAEELSDRAAAANPLSAAFKMVGGKTQPILAAVRGRAPSTGAAFNSMGGFTIPSTAGVSGKAVAAGLSKSMGAAATGTVKTVNTFRHGGEHRLHLSGLSRDPVASRVTWVTSKGLPFLGLLDGGFFRLYRIKRSVSANRNRQLQSAIGEKALEFRLPPILQTPCGPLTVGTLGAETNVWATMALPSSTARPPASSKLKSQPLSQAEIETNTPYQPFHTDQRVNLFVYSEMNDAETSVPIGQWVFGGSLPTSKLHVRPFSSHSEDDEDEMMQEHHQGFGGEMENLISLGNSTGNVEEVVITTRRKKKATSALASGNGVDDGFFEDDCEVLDFARDRV